MKNDYSYQKFLELKNKNIHHGKTILKIEKKLQAKEKEKLIQYGLINDEYESNTLFRMALCSGNSRFFCIF